MGIFNAQTAERPGEGKPPRAATEGERRTNSLRINKKDDTSSRKNFVDGIGRVESVATRLQTAWRLVQWGTEAVLGGKIKGRRKRAHAKTKEAVNAFFFGPMTFFLRVACSRQRACKWCGWCLKAWGVDQRRCRQLARPMIRVSGSVGWGVGLERKTRQETTMSHGDHNKIKICSHFLGQPR